MRGAYGWGPRAWVRFARMTAARRAFLDGFREVLPILVGLVPFGLITGVSSVGAGMTPFEAVVMSALVFAGAAQLAAISLIGTGGAVWAAVLTVAIVNLRHLMYSLALSPWLQRYGLASRLLVSFLMVDQSFALQVLKYPRAGEDYARVHYAVGNGLVTWAMWVGTTAVGAVVGAQIPPEWQLDFAVPLMFLGLLVPAVTTRPALLAALVGGTLATLLAPLPYNLGLIVGSLAGIAAGVVAEDRLPCTAGGTAET